MVLTNCLWMRTIIPTTIITTVIPTILKNELFYLPTDPFTGPDKHCILKALLFQKKKTF